MNFTPKSAAFGVSENSGFSPQIIHQKIGFSIIVTIHFGGFPPIFGNTQLLFCVFGYCGKIKIESLAAAVSVRQFPDKSSAA